jgi:acyl carrier protein
MGLDVVEIIMECEDEFGIAIPDEDFSAVRTAGDLHALVMRLLREGQPARERRKRPAKNVSDTEAWQIVRKILAEQLALPMEKIQPDSRLLEDLGAG